MVQADIARQNPAVMQNAAKCFRFVAEALEAETLQGQTAQRIVDSTKRMIAAAQLDGAQVLQGMSEATQRTVQTFFA